MSTKKIILQSPDKFLGKTKGDNQLARIAHVNHAIEIAQENNGETYQLDMPYMWYPEASQVIKSGTVINYAGGPAWVGYKISGAVVPNYGTGGINGRLLWYLCTVKTKQGSVSGPIGIIPYALTGSVQLNPDTMVEQSESSVTSIGKGALVWDTDNNEPAAVDNMYIYTNTWNDGTPQEDGFLYQDLFLVIETELPSYRFGCFYQFEYLLPEGSETSRFFD